MNPSLPVQQAGIVSPSFLAEVRRRREYALEQIARIPIAALIWGPAQNADTAVARARVTLRDELRRYGHVAHFSEELYEPTNPYSVMAQQAADIESHDVVFSMPASPGSIAEAHDFFRTPHLARKLITFVDATWNDGYANKSLIESRSLATADIVLYQHDDLPDCIVSRALDIVRRLQEWQFLMGRRS
jgi:hypothetical protein